MGLIHPSLKPFVDVFIEFWVKFFLLVINVIFSEPIVVDLGLYR